VVEKNMQGSGIMTIEQSGWFIILLPPFAMIYGLFVWWYINGRKNNENTNR
jgi:hypothetical protein